MKGKTEMKYIRKKNKHGINEYDFQLTEDELEKIDEIKELIREEYKTKGWVIRIHTDFSPSFWDKYYELLHTLIDIDENIIDEVQADFEERYLNSTFEECTELNISLLDKKL